MILHIENINPGILLTLNIVAEVNEWDANIIQISFNVIMFSELSVKKNAQHYQFRSNYLDESVNKCHNFDLDEPVSAVSYAVYLHSIAFFLI
jgi:hypothetical protein